MICSILAYAIVDVVLMLLKKPTFSSRMLKYKNKIPFLPTAWGVLATHFFSGTEVDYFGHYRYIFLACIGIFYIIISIKPIRIINKYAMINFVVGMVTGFFFWSQNIV
jgi:hypothetical protein